MARKSSRKYYKSTAVYDTRVISLGHKKNSMDKLESFYLMLHPEGMTMVTVTDNEKTVFLSRYGGFEHVEERMAVFDHGHLKRVTRTFVQDCLAKVAGEPVKNSVMHKADFIKERKKLKLGL